MKLNFAKDLWPVEIVGPPCQMSARLSLTTVSANKGISGLRYYS